jgi:transposase-like protein
MHCPKCLSKKHVKNGKKYGKQRHECKECGCHFTQSHKRGACLEIKLQALEMYLEGMGFRGIGRILGVSNVTVLYWIRNLGKAVKEYVQTQMPDDIRHVDIIEMDEMWHFTKKKNANCGSGSQSIDTHKKYWDFPWAAGVKKPSKNYLAKNTSLKSKV